MNPAHRYAAPGLYVISLQANQINAPGSVCSASVQKVIRIVDSLPTDFDMKISSLSCFPVDIEFTSFYPGTARVEWDFGDGSKGFGNQVRHTYSKNGVYYPRLFIYAEGGCVYSAVKKVEIMAPKGNFMVDSGLNCSNRPIRFEANPEYTDSIVWDFGDGNKLVTTERVVYHTYRYAGNYRPSVTFRSSTGCSYIVPHTYTISIEQIDAGFQLSSLNECGKTTVQFADTSRVFFGKARVDWRFGDGTMASGTTVRKTFDLTNRYLVQQIVAGVSGCTDTVEVPVDVFVRSLPTAEILLTDPVCTGKETNFRAFLQSADSITVYNWQFSNGIKSDKASFSATISNPGNYSVRFITGTRFGCYDTASASFTVHASPVVKAAPDVTICKGSNVQLSASGAAAYSWYPGNGLSCVDCPLPVAQPAVTTTYTVKGTTAVGCFSYDTVLISVIQPFKMTVSPSDSICTGESYLLLASNASKYQWTPALGLNRSDISNPVATPATTTVYRVVGFDEFNCFTDTGFVTVGVGRYPVIDLGPDTLLATGSIFPLRSMVTNGPIRDWRWSPSADLSCASCPEPVATIRKDITYAVTGTTYFGCSGSDTIRIRTFCKDAQVYIPNGFSPDGDGINDVFMVRGSGIMQVKSIRVFSRWGDIVFERINVLPNDPASGWDGRVRGVVKGPDVFAYTVEVVCDNGTPYVFKGNVTLLK